MVSFKYIFSAAVLVMLSGALASEQAVSQAPGWPTPESEEKRLAAREIRCMKMFPGKSQDKLDEKEKNLVTKCVLNFDPASEEKAARKECSDATSALFKDMDAKRKDLLGNQKTDLKELTEIKEKFSDQTKEIEESITRAQADMGEAQVTMQSSQAKKEQAQMESMEDSFYTEKKFKAQMQTFENMENRFQSAVKQLQLAIEKAVPKIRSECKKQLGQLKGKDTNHVFTGKDMEAKCADELFNDLKARQEAEFHKISDAYLDEKAKRDTAIVDNEVAKKRIEREGKNKVMEADSEYAKAQKKIEDAQRKMQSLRQNYDRQNNLRIEKERTKSLAMIQEQMKTSESVDNLFKSKEDELITCCGNGSFKRGEEDEEDCVDRYRKLAGQKSGSKSGGSSGAKR